MVNTHTIVANKTDHRRAACWLKRHGLSPTHMSPLLLNRLAIRRTSHEKELLYLALAAIPLIAWSIIADVADISMRLSGSDMNIRGLIDIAAFYIVLAAITWWSSTGFLKTERELAKELPRRATRSMPRTLTHVLGKWYVAAIVALYPGGVTLGLILSITPFDMETRALGALMAGGTIAIGAVNIFVNYKMIQRPAVADTSANLAIDEGLRTEEAHRIPPYAAALAIIVAVYSSSTIATICFLSYGLVAAALWCIGVLRGQHRTLNLLHEDSTQ